MDFETFARSACDVLPAGLILKNPGRGTSTIMWVREDEVCYRRGHHRFYIGMRDLYEAYKQFAGGKVTTNQLKQYLPSLYDSAMNGHNCHCTFFFLVLQRMGLVSGIWGSGRVGSPFGVTIGAPE